MSERWLSDYDRISAKIDEVQAAINERQRLAQNGSDLSKVTSLIRRLFNELGAGTTALEQQLEDAGRQYLIPDKEFTRRQDLIATLRKRHEHQENAFRKSLSSGGGNAGDARALLMGGGGAGGAAKPRTETDATRLFDDTGLLQQQEQIMRDQDQGLDLLSQSLARQRQIGMQISSELDDQNAMLDDVRDGVDNTHARLRRETKHVEYISEKTKTGGMLCCIVLLIIGIIVVAALPI